MSRFEELPLDSPMVVVTRLPPIELWCTAPASGTPRSVSLTKAPMTQATFAGVCAYQPPQERRLPKRNVTHGMGKLTDNRSVRCPPPGMPKRFGSNVVEEYHSQHWLVKSNLAECQIWPKCKIGPVCRYSLPPRSKRESGLTMHAKTFWDFC
jgi:hypothetical protein